MRSKAKICGYDGKKILVEVPQDIEKLISYRRIENIEIIFDDGRTITADQRKKAYATINDIADYTGHFPEYLKEWFKYKYIATFGGNYFSLSDCSITTAKEYINYLIDFCLQYGVPIKNDRMINRTDDIDAYLYMCLKHKKCAVCGRDAEVHHVDHVGMGRDRTKINHLGMRAIALCRKHHTEAHQRGQAFMDENHIYGIELNVYLCKKLNLNYKERKI